MKVKLILSAISLSAIIAITFQLIGHSYFGLLKAITTILIIQIVLSHAPLNESVTKRFRKVILIGLIFCLIGDVVLLEEAQFIYGLLAFLAAHLLFCYGFYDQNSSQLGFISLALFALIGVSYFVFLLPNLGGLAIPVAVYILVIVCMSWLATEMYLSNKSTSSLAIFVGAILFLISDATLAYNKFVGEFSYSSVAILSTYWLAITLFAYSTVATKSALIK